MSCGKDMLRCKEHKLRQMQKLLEFKLSKMLLRRLLLERPRDKLK